MKLISRTMRGLLAVKNLINSSNLNGYHHYQSDHYHHHQHETLKAFLPILVAGPVPKASLYLLCVAAAYGLSARPLACPLTVLPVRLPAEAEYVDHPEFA